MRPVPDQRQLLGRNANLRSSRANLHRVYHGVPVRDSRRNTAGMCRHWGLCAVHGQLDVFGQHADL
jgi:hypothetical protein